MGYLKKFFKRKSRFGNQAGFSLIELMVVVAIIGILAAVAIPQYRRFQMDAKATEGKVMVSAYYKHFKVSTLAPVALSNIAVTGMRPEGPMRYNLGFESGISKGDLKDIKARSNNGGACSHNGTGSGCNGAVAKASCTTATINGQTNCTGATSANWINYGTIADNFQIANDAYSGTTAADAGKLADIEDTVRAIADGKVAITASNRAEKPQANGNFRVQANAYISGEQSVITIDQAKEMTEAHAW